MGITLKKGSASSASYSIKGDTLADISAQIDKSGPKDPNDGKRYSGSCLCKADLDSKSTKMDKTVEPKGDKFEAEMWMSGGTLSYACTITMPKLGSNKLSKDAKKEWDRFYKAVDTHENGHVTSYETELKALIKEIEAMRGKGNGSSEKDAVQAAFKNFAEQFKKINLTDRLNQNAAAYDKKNGHGKTQGAVLDAKIK
jgi:predicted secreted Zn-dependent protease